MKTSFLLINIFLMSAVFAGNYFYIKKSRLLLKGLCSFGFVLMGVLNLLFALWQGADVGYPAVLALGLILAMLGDIFLDSNFVAGAVLFAAGHLCFFYYSRTVRCV